MHKLKTILLVAAILLSILFSAVLLIPLKYEDQIKKILIEQLDESLSVPLKINSIDLSLIRHFPKASIIVRDMVLTGSDNASPLASVERISLMLNLAGLFKNNYILERVEVQNSTLNIHIDQNNEANYNIFKHNRTDSKPYRLNLKKININNLRINYVDDAGAIYSSIFFNNINLNGTVDTLKAAFKSSFTAQIDSFQYDSLTIFRNLPFKSSGHITLADDFSEYNFDNLDLTINNRLSFMINGSYSRYWNLKIALQKADLNDIIQLIPEKFVSSFDYLSADGKVSLDAALKGNENKNKMPGLELKLVLKDGTLGSKNSGTILKGLSFHTLLTAENLDDPRSYYVNLNKLYARDKKGELTGTIKIRDFKDINSLIKIKSNLALSTLTTLIPQAGSLEIKGKADIDLGYTGKISEIIDKKIQGKQSFSGIVLLKDMEFIPYKGTQIHDAGAELTFSGSKVTIQNLDFKSGKSDVNLTGQANNLLEWLVNKETTMIITGKLSSKLLVLDDFIPDDENELNSEANIKIQLPEHIEAKIHLDCKKLHYKETVAENINGEMLVGGFGIVFNRLTAQVFEGRITANGRLFGEGKQISLDGIFDLEDIDITQLFNNTQNFGQDYITAQNLKGKVDGQVKVNSFWNPDLTPDYDKLFAIADLSIVDGELNNFKTIDRLFGFIKAKQLKNVKFDKLENTFLIKDQIISIPQMDINSNVMNLTMSGEYGFDDHINYQVKVNLTDFFFRNNRHYSRATQSGEDDGQGGINLFVSMTGTSDNPEIRYNKTAVKEQINKGLKKEGRELKNIFDKSKRKKVTEEYEFEWDDGK